LALVVPPLVSQTAHLIQIAPSLLEELKSNPSIANLNDQYAFIDTLEEKFSSITSDGTLIITAFGGVIGVGKTVLSGTFTSSPHFLRQQRLASSLFQQADAHVFRSWLMPSSHRSEPLLEVRF
jgi:hypothetical protein